MTRPGKYEEKKAAQVLSDALKELPENRVMCRGLRHAWEIEEDFHVHPVKGTQTVHLRRTFVCMRDCGCRVIEIFMQTRYHGIERIARYMAYPDGYQIPGVPRGVKPLHIIQQEQYRRAMEKVAKSAKGQTEAAER